MRTFIITLLCLTAAAAVTAQEPAQPKAVHFKKLQAFLPAKAPAGFTRGKPTGSTHTMTGFSVSEAKVRFERPSDTVSSAIEASISDMTQMPAAAWAAMYEQAEYENETEEGSERTVTVAKSYKGIEKVQSGESRSCELSFVVAQRFHVQFTGIDTDEIALLYALAESMDLAGLAKTAKE